MVFVRSLLQALRMEKSSVLIQAMGKLYGVVSSALDGLAKLEVELCQ